MIAVGTAGWSIPRASASAFPSDGHHLERYSRVMSCVEIDSSFYRSHRAETYARWAEETPARFRFAVKLPRTITHEGRLRRAKVPLEAFLSEVAGLAAKLAILLVQLPPSFAFEPRAVRTFFALLRERHAGSVVCEPRHATWFTPAAERMLAAYRIARAAADPARIDCAAQPGGWLGPAGDGNGAPIYYRWHGSPRMYWSAYTDAWLKARAAEVNGWPAGSECWCIFDNTASGAALADALRFATMLGTAGARGSEEPAGPAALRRTRAKA